MGVREKRGGEWEVCLGSHAHTPTRPHSPDATEVATQQSAAGSAVLSWGLLCLAGHALDPHHCLAVQLVLQLGVQLGVVVVQSVVAEAAGKKVLALRALQLAGALVVLTASVGGSTAAIHLFWESLAIQGVQGEGWRLI